jgi:hypothetical protein
MNSEVATGRRMNGRDGLIARIAQPLLGAAPGRRECRQLGGPFGELFAEPFC